MRKLFKSRKALSPVVAAIILIAVTVAVSIAVAAWMGALTFTFMSTEQITFTNYQWDTTAPVTWFKITVKNTGSSDLSIASVRIDGVDAATVDPLLTSPYLLVKGASQSFNVTRTGNFASGVSYEFTVLTAKGNTFGPYTKTAP